MVCELCNAVGGELIWQDDLCRVVRIDDSDYPGFCRVILSQHIKEMTDLTETDRVSLMHVVFAVEQAILEVFQPDKINLASLGNKTPHLHWHVIPRFDTDRTFPNSIWGEQTHEALPRKLDSNTSAKLKCTINALLN